MFGIPSFGQIVNLLHDRNTRESGLIGEPRKTSGLFVELKRSQFFLQDANISIADLFLNELATHPKAGELLFDHAKICQQLEYDEYRVPPLVVQSFEGDTLEYLRTMFKRRWMDFVEEDAILSDGIVSGDNSTVAEDQINHPWIPPFVLLVNSDICRTNEFWFHTAKYHISGIGPDKECLLPSKVDINLERYGIIERSKKEAKEWVAMAHSLGLAVHPWTIMPELRRKGQLGGVPLLFPSSEDELRYYYCELNVDGIFTEDIAAAQIVGREGCGSLADEDSATERGGPVCVEEERSLWFFGLSFMALGTFVGSVVSCFVWACAGKGYCDWVVGRWGHSSLRLPEVDTTIEEDDGRGVL